MNINCTVDGMQLTTHATESYNWLECCKWSGNGQEWPRDIEYQVFLYFQELATLGAMIDALETLRQAMMARQAPEETTV